GEGWHARQSDVEAGGRRFSLSHGQAEVLAEIAEREVGSEPCFLFTGHRLHTARCLLHDGLITQCPRGPYWFTLSAAGAEAYDALPGRYRSSYEWVSARAAMAAMDRCLRCGWMRCLTRRWCGWRRRVAGRRSTRCIAATRRISPGSWCHGLRGGGGGRSSPRTLPRIRGRRP